MVALIFVKTKIRATYLNVVTWNEAINKSGPKEFFLFFFRYL